MKLQKEIEGEGSVEKPCAPPASPNRLLLRLFVAAVLGSLSGGVASYLLGKIGY